MLALGLVELWLPLLTLQRLKAGICQSCDGEAASRGRLFHYAPSFPTWEEIELEYAIPAPISHSIFTLLYLSVQSVWCWFSEPSHKNPNDTRCEVSPPEAGAPTRLVQSLAHSSQISNPSELPSKT